MTRKLTESQLFALKRLPVEITAWGCQTIASTERGVRRSTLRALVKRSLAKKVRVGEFVYEYRITDAGRAEIE